MIYTIMQFYWRITVYSIFSYSIINYGVSCLIAIFSPSLFLQNIRSYLSCSTQLELVATLQWQYNIVLVSNFNGRHTDNNVHAHAAICVMYSVEAMTVFFCKFLLLTQ